RYENGRWGLAKTLEEAGRTAEAEKAYRDGIAEFPESYPLLFHFAGFLTNQGKLDEAEDAWLDAIGAAEGAGAHLAYARLLVKMNAEEAAWEEARLALVADPRHVEARLFLAERYALAGKTLGAAMELSRAWRTFPGDASAAARFLDFTAEHPETRGRATVWLPRIVARFTALPKDETLRRA